MARTFLLFFLALSVISCATTQSPERVDVAKFNHAKGCSVLNNCEPQIKWKR